MRYVLFLVGAILFSAPAQAQAQAQANAPQEQSGPVTFGSALFTVAGVVTGVLAGDYFLGGNMAVRMISGYAPQIGRMGGMRGFPLGIGLMRPIVLAGSGILGGYIARNLSK